EPVVGLVEVEELALLLDERAAAVEVVLPAVVLAHELAAAPRRFLAGIVLPDELVAPVAADVVERAHLAVETTHDDDRRLGDRELLGEVAAVARQLLHPPDVQPRALEDRLALEVVELRGDGVLVRDRRGAELGVVLGPAALGRLGEAPRAHLSRSWP